MPQPIPDPWRQRVIAALKTEDDRVIDWTPMAIARWKNDTFGAWKFEAYEALAAALANPAITGNQTSAYADQAAAYEFLFTRGTNLMYAKIALKADRVRILIVSAHNAERSSL